MHRGQHDAVLNRAIERQAEIIVDLLNRAYVVMLVDTHRQRMRSEQAVIEIADLDTDKPCVFFGGGLSIQFIDTPRMAVHACHHQLVGARQHVMCGEHLEIQPGVDQYDRRSPTVKLTVVVDVRVGQVIVVAGGAAEMRNAAKGSAECGEHDFFAAGQPVQQGQGKAVILDRRQRIAAAIAA